jgi:hypothetical protein
MVEEKAEQDTNKQWLLLSTCFHAGFLPVLFFDHENGGDMFLRNFG